MIPPFQRYRYCRSGVSESAVPAYMINCTLRQRHWWIPDPHVMDIRIRDSCGAIVLFGRRIPPRDPPNWGHGVPANSPADHPAWTRLFCLCDSLRQRDKCPSRVPTFMQPSEKRRKGRQCMKDDAEAGGQVTAGVAQSLPSFGCLCSWLWVRSNQTGTAVFIGGESRQPKKNRV